MFRTYYGIPKDVKYGEEFMSRFPILFQNRKLDMSKTCMCWGIECPIGWYNILEQLCTALEYHNLESTRSHRLAIVADQVKEKFGTLRFYYTVRDVNENGEVVSMPDEIDEDKRQVVMDFLEMAADNLIEEAEKLTENTCAACGEPLTPENKVETRGWITYICKRCDEKGKDAWKQEEDADENVSMENPESES